MRLDHLLSKEHHENAFPLGRGEAVMGPCAVVAAAGCTTDVSSAGWAGGGSPNTLLGFETTSPFSWGLRLLGGVLSPRLWWWGVVFDLWIVVASIERSGLVSRSLMCNFSKLVCIFIVVSV